MAVPVASTEKQVCLGCGEVTQKRNRRVLGSTSEQVAILWKDVISKELELRRQQINLDNLLHPGRSYMCRRCYHAYDKLLQAKKAIVSRMKNAIDMIVSDLGDIPSERQQGLKRSNASDVAPSLPPAKRKPILPVVPVATSTPHCNSPQSHSATSTSPSVSVNIGYKHGVRQFILTPTRKHMGKAVARRSKSAIVADVFEDPISREFMLRKIGVLLRRELTLMCCEKTKSILNTQCMSDLQQFSWKKFLSEMASNAPLLLSILQSCTYTRKCRLNRNAAIGMCCAILLKLRYSKMSMVQRIVSLILYAGNSGKQVYGRLQKIHLSMSHMSTNRLVNNMGNDHDLRVKQWRDKITACLTDADGQSNEENSTSIPIVSRVPDDVLALSSCDSMDSSTSDVSSDITAPQFSPISSDASSIHDELVELGGHVHSENIAELCCVQETIPSDASTLCASQMMTEYNSTKRSLSLGYKLVGDNIDKGVKARYMRAEVHRNQSLHYFHCYAIQNRIDHSNYPDVHPPTCKDSPRRRALALLPSKEDDSTLRMNIAVLVSRVLTEHMPFFKHTFDDVVTWHIKHQHSAEMSSKSLVVPLGVILKNENRGDDMVEILSHMHRYVPVVQYTKSVRVPITGEEVQVSQASLHQILFGGDQLTSARARGAIRTRMNSLSPIARLGGLIPCAEDWHVKLNLLDVIWKYYYSANSARNHGTMYQLRNLISRSNVSAHPVKSYNESDDFFRVIVTGHILAAALKHLHMKSLADVPSITAVEHPEDLWMETSEQRTAVLQSVCEDIVDKFVDFEFNKLPIPSTDKVLEYAKRLLGLGCFYLEFSDAVKEGSGPRVLRCWKYLLPIFKSCGRKNYAVEVLNMLCQYYYELTPRQSQELIWSRFVSLHSAPGRNIPGDLHQEHLNRLCKECIRGLGSNKTEKAITRVGKALGTLQPLLDNFDSDNNVADISGAHKKPSFAKDRDLIIQHLEHCKTFTPHNDRFHPSFPIPKDVLHSIDQTTLVHWMVAHI